VRLRVNPYDLDAHKLLLEITEKSGDNAATAREQRAIAALEKMNPSDKIPDGE
jgi:hypothetical protein